MQKILEVQKEIGTIKKDCENPFFKSKYFDINSLISALKPLLNKHGLVVFQPLITENSRLCLKTMIVDAESGATLVEGTALLPETPDPQKMGSIITYFRRYALQSLFFLEAEDDDGNAAVAKTPAKTYPAKAVVNKVAPPATFKEMTVRVDKDVINQKDGTIIASAGQELYQGWSAKNSKPYWCVRQNGKPISFMSEDQFSVTSDYIINQAFSAA